MHILFFLVALLTATVLNRAEAITMQHHGMSMDEKGMIMNDNANTLPQDCPKIVADVNLTIRAGHKHAKNFNGKMFAFDQQQWEVAGCTRLNITLINDDEIRHQLMIHGLPGYLYPDGMFTIEIYGKGQKTASIIVPSKPKTYLVHCEVPQHMEKGMKAQLKVAGGDGDLPSIPGLTAPVKADEYQIAWNNQTWAMLIIAGLVGPLGLLLIRSLLRKRKLTQDALPLNDD